METSFQGTRQVTRWICFSAGLLAFLLLWQARAAVPQTAPERSAGVAVGSDTGMAGGTVLIPLSLQATDGLDIGNISFDIPIPEALVRLQGIRLSLAMDMAGGEVKAEVAAQKTDDKNSAVIHVTVSAKKPLAPGPLATLDLRIADEVGDTASVPLRSVNVRLTTLDGHPLTPTKSLDGEIKISKSPPTFVNCFFFSH